MTVYVDDMFKYPIGRSGRMKMSHLMADTDAELYAMADRIGVARRWVQHAKLPSDIHFDISMTKREEAIRAGAVEVTLREMSAYQWHRRKFGTSVHPREAAELMRRHFAGRAPLQEMRDGA